MPFFAPKRGRNGFAFPCLRIAWSTLFLWTCALLWSYLQSVCFRREWQASTRTSFMKGAGKMHGTAPPGERHSIWMDLYARSAKGSNDIKPRIWPHSYESLLRTNNAAESMTDAAPWASRNETFHRLHKFEDTCQPRSNWHSFSFPTCNVLHEISIQAGLTSSAYQDENKEKGEMRASYGFFGATRETWFLRSSACEDGTYRCPGTSVLKTLRWRELHDQMIHNMQRIDALVSERLSSSLHVIDIYAYCGASALNQYADGGMFAKTFRHKYSDGGTFTDRELLVFARDAALALADVHDLDGRGNVTSFVHHDLRAENFLTSNGKLMISDFNNGQLLRWDFEKDERCSGFDWSGGCGKTMEQTNRKAPEECLEESNRTFTTEKVEIYRFGAFLFFLLSRGNWAYSYERLSNNTIGRLKPEAVRKNIVSGKGPSLPPYVKESSSRDIKAIVEAMRMAYTYDKEKRPSAREIADYLLTI